MNLMPFDELELLRAKLEAKKQIDAEDTIDELLDLMIISYMNGNKDANESLSIDMAPNINKFQEQAYKEYDGKTFIDRINEYAESGSVEEIMRVAETDVHRLYNAGVYDTALDSGLATYKRWHTMLDDRVREQHYYLEEQRVPLDADFYTYTGDHAKAPGLFQDAENNCGCRCWVTVERE